MRRTWSLRLIPRDFASLASDRLSEAPVGLMINTRKGGGSADSCAFCCRRIIAHGARELDERPAGTLTGLKGTAYNNFRSHLPAPLARIARRRPGGSVLGHPCPSLPVLRRRPEGSTRRQIANRARGSDREKAVETGDCRDSEGWSQRLPARPPEALAASRFFAGPVCLPGRPPGRARDPGPNRGVAPILLSPVGQRTCLALRRGAGAGNDCSFRCIWSKG